MEWDDIYGDIYGDMRSRAWNNFDELNDWLATKTRAYNTTPQERLSGLTPEQAARLFSDDWTGGGPLRLNTSLPLSDLRGARFLMNARLVLSTLQAEGAVKATTTKSFPRAFVAAVVDRMVPGDDLHELARELGRVRKENDYFPLHMQRVLVRMAGLIKLRSGKYSLTRKGEELLPDEQAGVLYSELFQTYFRRFNLDYLDGYAPNEALQQTLAMTLYRLGRNERVWKEPQELAEDLLMEEAFDQSPDFRGENAAYAQFELRVLRSLEAFGLIEKRELERLNHYRPRHAYRVSDLFGRFIRFVFA